MEIHRRGHCVLDSQPNKIKLRIQYDRCSGLISRLYRGHSVNDSFEMPGRELTVQIAWIILWLCLFFGLWSPLEFKWVQFYKAPKRTWWWKKESGWDEKIFCKCFEISRRTFVFPRETLQFKLNLYELLHCGECTELYEPLDFREINWFNKIHTLKDSSLVPKEKEVITCICQNDYVHVYLVLMVSNIPLSYWVGLSN